MIHRMFLPGVVVLALLFSVSHVVTGQQDIDQGLRCMHEDGPDNCKGSPQSMDQSPSVPVCSHEDGFYECNAQKMCDANVPIDSLPSDCAWPSFPGFLDSLAELPRVP